MARVPALVPAEHTSDHVLVVPRPADDVGGPSRDLPTLAAAWFDDVGWLSAPSAAASFAGPGGMRPMEAPRCAPSATSTATTGSTWARLLT